MKILDKYTAESIINMSKWDGKFLKPWDSLTFSEDGAKYCSNYWKSFVKDKTIDDNIILSDVILSGKIPTYDMLLETDSRKNRGDVLYARIILFPDLVDRVTDLTGELYAGIIILYTELAKVFIPFKVSGKSDGIIFEDNIGIIAESDEEYNFYVDNPDVINEDVINNGLMYYMKLWYGVMITLLNPATKIVIHEAVEPREGSGDSGTPGSGKLKYVRHKVIITEDNFIEVVEHGEYMRHTNCWLVSGHWRDQPTKNGVKRIFIKPHWRGPLRELKDHDTRDRELVYHGGDS